MEQGVLAAAKKRARLISRAFACAGAAALFCSAAIAAAAPPPLPPARPADLATPSRDTKPNSDNSLISETPPLPPARPSDLTPLVPEPPAVHATEADNEALRAQVLNSHHVAGESLETINEPGGCGIFAPLRVDAIVLADGSKIALTPPPVLRAAMAATLADWLRENLAPAMPKDDRLVSIEGVGGYVCRSRNWLPGAVLSEHATGNALDLHAFVTARGRHLTVAASADSATTAGQAFLALAKKTACARFMTVLGPGADAHHTEHLHIDLMARRNGVRLCQWNLQDVSAAAAP